MQTFVDIFLEIAMKLPLVVADMRGVSLKVAEDKTLQDKLLAVLTGADEILSDLLKK